MDALLTSDHVEIINKIRGPKKTFMIINNQFKSMTNLTAYISKPKDMTESILQLGKLLGVENKRVAVCTNSKTFALEVKATCDKSDISCLLMVAGTVFVPVTEWTKYKCVVYTPFINNGVSQNVPYFDCEFGFFTNKSATPSSAFQQIGRIRNKIDNKVYIHYLHDVFDEQDETENGIIEQFTNKTHVVSKETGLRYNYVDGSIKRNTFLKAVVMNQIERNKGMNNFLGVLRGYLEHHGFNIVDTEMDTFDEEMKKMARDEIDATMNKISTDDAKDVVNARDITFEEYQQMKNLTLSKEDNLAVHKYLINCAYGYKDNQFQIENIPKFKDRVEFVKKYGVDKEVKRRKKFKRIMNIVKQPRYNYETNTPLTISERFKFMQKIEIGTMETINNKQLLDFNTDIIKMKHVYGSITAAGFGILNWDDMKVPDFKGLLKYYHSHQAELKALYPRKVLKVTDNQYLMTYFSAMWKEFGFGLRRATSYKGDQNRILSPVNIKDFNRFGIDVYFDEVDTEQNLQEDELGVLR